MLVNKLLSLVFDQEIAQFFEDGVYDRPHSLLNAAYEKFLEFPPVHKNKPEFEKAVSDVMGELPELIQAYNKYAV